MKGEKLFMVSIVMEFVGLVGIIIAYPFRYIFPVLSAWIGLICFITVCVGLILSLAVLFIYAFE